jgi:hypothetical protein
VAHTFGEEHDELARGELFRQRPEARAIALGALGLGSSSLCIDGPINRHGAQGPQQCTEQGPGEETVSRADGDGPWARREDQRRVDQAVRVPGNEQTAPDAR